MVGKPPDVCWVSEDVLLHTIAQRHDPECDSTLLELLMDYTVTGTGHTVERPHAIGLKGMVTAGERGVLEALVAAEKAAKGAGTE
eukprot:6369522-Prymnesium_polylepis.2